MGVPVNEIPMILTLCLYARAAHDRKSDRQMNEHDNNSYVRSQISRPLVGMPDF